MSMLTNICHGVRRDCVVYIARQLQINSKMLCINRGNQLLFANSYDIHKLNININVNIDINIIVTIFSFCRNNTLHGLK